MTVFVVQPENPLKFGVLIESFQDGARIPAILVSGAQNDFPVETHGLAGNVASLLNGASASETLHSDGAAIHFRRHAHGVTLQHRDPAGGVSVPGLNITVLESLPKADREAVLAQITPAFMVSLCGSIDTQSRDTQPSGPQPKQGFQP